MKASIKVVVIIPLFISLFFLTACSSKSNLEKIKLAEVTRSIFYAPQYVALEKGFFEEEGLDVDLTTTWGGDKTMTALLSDSADIALVGSETSVYVYVQGAHDPVINFAHIIQNIIQGKYIPNWRPISMKKLLLYKENDEFVLEHINSFNHSTKKCFISENGLKEELELYQPVLDQCQVINQLACLPC